MSVGECYRMEALRTPTSRLCKEKEEVRAMMHEKEEEMNRLAQLNESLEGLIDTVSEGKYPAVVGEAKPVQFLHPDMKCEVVLDLPATLIESPSSALLEPRKESSTPSCKPLLTLLAEQEALRATAEKMLPKYDALLGDALAWQESCRDGFGL